MDRFPGARPLGNIVSGAAILFLGVGTLVYLLWPRSYDTTGSQRRRFSPATASLTVVIIDTVIMVFAIASCVTSWHLKGPSTVDMRLMNDDNLPDITSDQTNMFMNNNIRYDITGETQASP